MAEGRVTDAAGKPLNNAQISFRGTTDAGQTKYDSSTVRPDGTYAVTLPSGRYVISGTTRVTFMDREFILALAPVDGIMEPQDVSQGIVKDFRWQLSGAKREDRGRSQVDYYGAAVLLSRLDDNSRLPPGANLTITLTPLGALVDGSQGRPLTFTRPVEALNRPEGGQYAIEETRTLPDIPLGRYQVTGTLTLPNGGTMPLQVGASPKQPTRFDTAPSAELTFVPGTVPPYAGTEAARVFFTVSASAPAQGAPLPTVTGAPRSPTRTRTSTPSSQ